MSPHDLTNPLGQFAYHYDPSSGRLSGVDLPNGAQTVLTYLSTAQSGRLESITHLNPQNSALSTQHYGYDPSGQITSWTQSAAGATTKSLAPGYDAAGQLRTLTVTDPASTVLSQQSWDFDNAGNRTKQVVDGHNTSYSPNSLNQLLDVRPDTLSVVGSVDPTAQVQVNGVPATLSTDKTFQAAVPATFGTQVLTITAQAASGSSTQHYLYFQGQKLIYDLNGNMTSDGIHQYDWDAANRLIRISDLHPSVGSPAHVSEFTYDGLWRRVEIKEKQGLQTVADRKFVWAGAEIKEERDASNNVVKRFYGSGVQVVQGPLGGVYLYTRDHLGSVRGVLDGAGNQVAAYDYDVWGNRTQTAGTFVADFGYAGYFEHAPSGLKLTLARGYSAGLGRWISRDPIGEIGGINIYQYAQNRPMQLIDVYGLFCWASAIKGLLMGVSGGIGLGITVAWAEPAATAYVMTGQWEALALLTHLTLASFESLGDAWENFKDAYKGKGFEPERADELGAKLFKDMTMEAMLEKLLEGKMEPDAVDAILEYALNELRANKPNSPIFSGCK